LNFSRESDEVTVEESTRLHHRGGGPWSTSDCSVPFVKGGFMNRRFSLLVSSILMLGAFAGWGCSDKQDDRAGDGGADTTTDADIDGDTDGDADADTDADTKKEGERGDGGVRQNRKLSDIISKIMPPSPTFG
jgi:hypothetical protein